MKACGQAFLSVLLLSGACGHLLAQDPAQGPVQAPVQTSPQETVPAGAIQLRMDASEAKAVLDILEARASGRPPTEADWQRLFSTEPYLSLERRESAMHVPFTRDEFKAFVLSADLAKRAESLRLALEAWKKADLAAAARRILPYLPARARIRAKVFPVIKPKANSFVFETETDPAIFLYLDPALPAAKVENTVAHEMHHIGFASLEDENAALLKDLSPAARAAAEWVGAFGEGFAMLAAAGGMEVHPHAVGSREDRARWDKELGNFNADLNALETFFLEVIHQKRKTKAEISEKAFTFFGVQGPWYTVGYQMAIVIERQFGRAVLVECMGDPRKLLPTFNRAAREENKQRKKPLALWSQELVDALAGAPPKP
ncbi:DUF5700 domain-containing putative Zn-dependent protease [Geothrix sp. PMB-07]|uniref:DUF5700 domain-containing putative Zn-dependent protease n=1 Tax=Geothrix sp. PMB-07 TaxID=3068640 RepID=UPI002741F72D|nr:DUF5700 domain-containing putative Zn-dependent protease [Geothrix sp. PMB-07]WLT31862.1 DUF5700 domain-containing putative Zn-dependent protease [Geothrix sp. PMB-07]